MFNVKLTIGRKLICLVALQMIAIVFILGVAAYQLRDTLMEERRLALRNVVDAADSVVKRYARLEELGTLSREQAQSEALLAVSALRYGKGDYVWVNDLEMQMLYHPNTQLQGTNMKDYEDANGKRFFPELVAAVKRDGAGFVKYHWRRTEKAAPALKISYGKESAWEWVVASGLYADDVAATANERALRLGALLVMVALVLLTLSALVNRSITRPLKATVASLRELADGDGDLSRELPAHERDELGELGRAFNAFAGKLRGLVSETRGVAMRVSGAAGELSSVAEQVTRAAQSQAAGLEETAASLEQITATVKQNADSAQQANQLALSSHQAALKGGDVVTNAVAAMGEINDASRKIAEIIATIDEIAFQTNLLALNASVEAARAGEQGRGFAVVASEVQTLARRTATAAREIKALIEDSVAKIDAGSQLVNRSGETLKDIVASVKRVNDIIAEIAAASREQSAGVDQVSQAVTQMDQNVQSAASQTESLSNTAHNLSSEAMQLNALVGRFRLDARERAQRRVEVAEGMDFQQAIRAHMDWKIKLRAYIDRPDRSINAAEASRRDACALGKWLEGDGRRCANHPEYNTLVAEHARFHAEAAAIVKLADAGADAEASERLGAGSAFARISASVVTLIERLSAHCRGGNGASDTAEHRRFAA